jgi:hypothetical protein
MEQGQSKLPNFEQLEAIVEKIPAIATVGKIVFDAWKEYNRRIRRDELENLITACHNANRPLFPMLLGVFVMGYKKSLKTRVEGGRWKKTQIVARDTKAFGIIPYRKFYSVIDDDSEDVKNDFKHELSNYVEDISNNFPVVRDHLLKTSFHHDYYSYRAIIDATDAKGFAQLLFPQKGRK